MKKKKNKGIPDPLLNRIIDIISSNDRVREIILFGSRAKGNANRGSDIDLAIKGKNLTTEDIITLKAKLDDLPTAITIDLVIYDRISEPLLVDHVDRLGIELFIREKSG